MKLENQLINDEDNYDGDDGVGGGGDDDCGGGGGDDGCGGGGGDDDQASECLSPDFPLISFAFRFRACQHLIKSNKIPTKFQLSLTK